MEYIGISKAKEINEGSFIGNAYELENEVYSMSTFIYNNKGDFNHDITVVEDNIEVYKRLNGSYIYKVVK